MSIFGVTGTYTGIYSTATKSSKSKTISFNAPSSFDAVIVVTADDSALQDYSDNNLSTEFIVFGYWVKGRTVDYYVSFFEEGVCGGLEANKYSYTSSAVTITYTTCYFYGTYYALYV